MRDHTPEPWRVDSGKDYYTKGLHICGDADNETNGAGIAGIWDGRDELPESVQEANARRIVACVNACAGIPTVALEKLPYGVAVLDAFMAVQKQRDELLAALTVIAESKEICRVSAQRLAREAIERHRGQQ